MVDNLIKLFDANETDFSTNGLGVLSSAESCLVTEERNGIFELEMVYPINGQHYEDVALRRIIVTKSNPYSNPQPFRIYDISKPINGRVTISAEHISYDLSGYPVAPFTVTGIKDLFASMLEARIKDIPGLENFPFEFSYGLFSEDKFEETEFVVDSPRSIRSLLGGSENAFLEVFKEDDEEGEYEFDGYSVKFWKNRGHDNNVVTIRYGKNLTNVKQEENCASVYTAIYPYWYSKVYDELVTLPEKVVDANSGYDFTRVLTVDFSSKFSSRPTVDELREAAEEYIEENDIATPTVSIDISFEQLSRTSDYKDYAILEEVRLCDRVNVEFPKLGVSATAKCIKTIYNALAGKYDKIELGSAKSNLANSLSAQSKTVKESSSKAYVDGIVEAVTKTATGNAGGYVVIRNSKGEKEPDEILIMDKPKVRDAVNVWRWNKLGLSHSSEGYTDDESKYDVAIFQDGTINADFIKVGAIRTITIETCEIESCDFKSKIFDGEDKPRFSVNQEGELYASSGMIAGLTISRKQLNIAGSTSKRWASILSTPDESSFEIVVFEDGDKGSYITITDLQSTNATFSNSVKISNEITVGRSVNVGGLSFRSDDSLYHDGTKIIWFNYNPGATTITATLGNNSLSSTISITLDSPLISDRTFQLMLHTTWGSWKQVSMKMYPGETYREEVFSGPFWGYDNAYFVDSGDKTYSFTESKSAYIDFLRHIEPYYSNAWDLGSSSYRWRSGYIDHINTFGVEVQEDGESITSDRNKKKDVSELSDRYSELFDLLKPVSFRYRKNNSNRIHTGFIAQDVEDAMNSLNISSLDFAAYCERTENGETVRSLRYTEFIALNTYEIQKLKARVKKLEELAGA